VVDVVPTVVEVADVLVVDIVLLVVDGVVVVVVTGAVEVVLVELVLDVEAAVVEVLDVLVVAVVLLVVDELEVVVDGPVVEVVDVLVVDVVLLVVVVDSDGSPVRVIRAATTLSAANEPVRLAPPVTCSVASGAQSRPVTSALREIETRAPCENTSNALASSDGAGPTCDFGPMVTSPATKTCDAESASRMEPRRVRRLQNT